MSAANYDLIVFDWDGTLSDSIQRIVDAMHAALADAGAAPRSDTEVRDIIGLGLALAIARLTPDADAATREQAMARYRFHYHSTYGGGSALFAGASELLSDLHPRVPWLAVATGKSRAGLMEGLAESGVGQYFAATRTADDAASKPAPDMLLQLMNELGVEAERTLMIGDSEHDLQMARNAGVASLGVSYGVHPAAHLEQFEPLAIVDDLAGLSAWLGSERIQA